MTDTDREKRHAAESRHLSRRSFGRGAGAAFVVPGIWDASTAQTEEITVEGVFPDSVPTFDADDLTGLFVQVLARESEADPATLRGCVPLEEGVGVARYDVRILDRIQGDRRRAESTLFAPLDAGVIEEGGSSSGNLLDQVRRLAQSGGSRESEALFVVNRQTSCSGPYVGVSLERISGSTAGTPSNPAAGETVEPGVQNPDTTATENPGFGLVTALSAVVVLLSASVARLVGGDDE